MDSWVLNLPYPCWPGPEPRVLFRFFESLRRVVVLSSSNDPSREADPEACKAAGVPILRRRGGGGTVVLGPGCLICTLAVHVRDQFSNQRYFHAINAAWIDTLQMLGIDGLHQNGISDIVLQDRKVAGTSIFRKRHLLVYQGSLLVHPDMDQIGRLLRHPSREPEYRQGRSHDSFLTSLREAGYAHTASQLAEGCQQNFGQAIRHHLGADLVAPC